MYDPSKAEKYLKPGEMARLLSPVDREVYRAINERMPGEKVQFKTGLSKMAVVLACYRLTGLGLIEERERKPRKRRK